MLTVSVLPISTSQRIPELHIDTGLRFCFVPVDLSLDFLEICQQDSTTGEGGWLTC